jgi:hypothetical protein
MGRKTNRRGTNQQAQKPRAPRNFVALDALGITDGNKRKTSFDEDSRRMGTKRAIVMAAMREDY